jgi:hypothetical protein
MAKADLSRICMGQCPGKVTGIGQPHRVKSGIADFSGFMKMSIGRSFAAAPASRCWAILSACAWSGSDRSGDDP